jgi:hypothetical protein
MSSADPFDNFQAVAFRLEALPNYPEHGAAAPDFQAFLDTGNVPDGHNADWAKLITAAKNRGARVMRLRLVSQPLSEYEIFELLAGYRAGASAGEEIRVLPKPMNFASPDYWAYDAEAFEEMSYDPEGNFRGSEVRAMTDEDQERLSLHLGMYDSAVPLDVFRESILADRG